jgi:hypothetical protein
MIRDRMRRCNLTKKQRKFPEDEIACALEAEFLRTTIQTAHATGGTTMDAMIHTLRKEL